MGERIISGQSGIWKGWPLVLALVCGGFAYSDSFRGPFIWDDIDSIQRNPDVNRALPARGDVPTTLSGRPVLKRSFQIDYLLGEMRVWIYHATNLAIHLGCGAVLFGIVRRTLNLIDPARFAESADWLAGAVVALWLVHPLNTEAVTYIVQRAESLAGLFYLLVIYCVIRDWKIGAIIACALGMGTKEMVVTAPVMALIFDRAFMASSFGAALKRRPWMYIWLAATWVALFFAVGARSRSVGNILPMDYAITELGVMAHYVRLAFWPGELVLDYYDWPVGHAIGIGGMLVLIALIASILSLWWKPWLGFLGVWFFGILAPSSSVVPVFTEVAAEHRMYLPLISIVALVVVGGWVCLSRNMIGSWLAATLFTIALVALSTRTFLRNAEYADPQVIWADTVAARPENPRAHFNLGYSMMVAGKPAEAAPEFRRALELEPDYYAAARELLRAMSEAGTYNGPNGSTP